MQEFVYKTPRQMGAQAGAKAAELIAESIAANGAANIILATGTSQFETINTLARAEPVDFSKVTMFHLDEYIGLGPDHPASFRKYLKERFVDEVPELASAHFVNGDAPDPVAECERLGNLIKQHPIDVACVGIGENGHLAFNDPPADFETVEPYIIVDLDEKCRKQQLGEGWFDSLQDVPKRAISMSIQQILLSKVLIVSVPDERKARAVKDAVRGPITSDCPASILQTHQNCAIYLDEAAASLL